MELIKTIKFWNRADRIGPDMLSTYWRLFFKSTMRKLCVKKFVFFGEDSEVRPGAYIVGCSKISLGNRVIIRPGSMLHGASNNLDISIRIEDGAMLGPGCHIYVTNHTFSNLSIPIIDQGHGPSELVVIKRGAWLGANVIVLPGVTIGENSVIAAGAVVTKSIPDHVMAAGVPAKVIKSLKDGERCLEKL